MRALSSGVVIVTFVIVVSRSRRLLDCLPLPRFGRRGEGIDGGSREDLRGANADVERDKNKK